MIFLPVNVSQCKGPSMIHKKVLAHKHGVETRPNYDIEWEICFFVKYKEFLELVKVDGVGVEKW